MYPCPGNWVSIGRAVVLQAAHAFVQELNFHTVCNTEMNMWPELLGSVCSNSNHTSGFFMIQLPALINP